MSGTIPPPVTMEEEVVEFLLQLVCKQGGITVADYYHRLNALWKEFDAITKLPKCACLVKCYCAASTELALHQQLMKLLQFLIGLDDCYQPVRTALLTRGPLLDVKDAYATSSIEESHRGIPETSKAIDTKMNATSFAAKSYNHNKRGNTNNFNRNNTRGSGPNNYNRGPNHNLVCKNYDFTGHTIERPIWQVESLFNGNASFNVNLSKFYCGNTKFLVKTITLGWIIDSGANQHLTTSTISMINVVDISNLNITVGHHNGTIATISHVGDLKLLNNGITLWTGSESGGLYMFDHTKNKSLGNVNTVLAVNVLKDLWHNRLGHPADQAKQTREPFPLSDHKFVKPGELVHLGLWGPYKVFSREGFKYFLTIVDDYSRAVWTYLLKSKDESLEEDSATHIGDNILSEGNVHDENPDPNIVALVETTVLRKASPIVMKYFMGIEVLDDSNGICMTQRKYCLELIHEFGLLAAKPVTTHLPENCVLVVDESKSDKFLKNIFEYQKLLGKLIYLTHTRPDISYVVHCLSQHMHAPLQSHLKVALRVIRYLKNSPRIQIYKDKNLKLSCFTDSDWATCLRTRKSVSGYYVFFGRSLVSWKSKKQTTVSRSSAEAKYRCMASATCEVIWITNLLNDLCITNLLPVNLYSDSSSPIQIAANPVFYERTKHFKVDVHLVREKIQDGVKVSSADQTANLFTKGHGTTQHLKLCNQLSLVDMFGK
uniref:Ribonuclease H-like domain-containing protein n=1 Tax=Tanacetum cinerariifolium TaxID=118510 RepID=A0A699GVQ8_TANCI|nr:ribonuclease H-like domain-containing protein [Tanacetum cinerariifolium]